MPHATLPHRLAAGLVLLLACTVAFANEVEQHLQSEYRGKILVERGFFSGEHLMYDSAGTLTGGGRAGDWTTDGFVQIADIRIAGQQLKIKGWRLMVVANGKNGLRFDGESSLKKHKKPKKSALVAIEATTGSDSVSEEQADALLKKIFLISEDSFADVIPTYWKPCIEEGVAGKNENCRFSPAILAVPGITTPSRTAISAKDVHLATVVPSGSNATIKRSDAGYRVGGGVKPPRCIYQPEPVFSEAARKAKYQGYMTLGLIVGEDGLPQKIHILNPLGAGLDAQAAQMVATWKFEPAVKDGQAVPVEIAVEVHFELY